MIYCIILSCYHLVKKHLPKINWAFQWLVNVPKKSPWITASVAISCFLVIHEDQYQLSKVFGPLLIAQQEIESIPSELLQQFRPHAQERHLFELLKQLLSLSLVM
jgi:hypothetical protein